MHLPFLLFVQGQTLQAAMGSLQLRNPGLCSQAGPLSLLCSLGMHRQGSMHQILEASSLPSSCLQDWDSAGTQSHFCSTEVSRFSFPSQSGSVIVVKTSLKWNDSKEISAGFLCLTILFFFMELIESVKLVIGFEKHVSLQFLTEPGESGWLLGRLVLGLMTPRSTAELQPFTCKAPSAPGYTQHLVWLPVPVPFERGQQCLICLRVQKQKM